MKIIYSIIKLIKYESGAGVSCREILDNYLISLGCSIKDDYNYIPNKEYNYLLKEELKIIDVGKYKIPLDKKRRNSREFLITTYSSKNSFVQNVKLDDHVSDSCEILFNNALVYFTDYLKYIMNNLEINPELLQNLMMHCNASINELNKQIQKIVNENNVALSEAVRHGMEAKSRLDAQDFAKASTVYGSYTDYHDSSTFFGNSVTGTTHLMTGMSEKQLTNNLAINSSIAKQYEFEDKLKANEESLGSLEQLKMTIADNFNNKMLEILLLKLNDVFDYDTIFNISEDIEKTPTIIKNYIKIIPELNENDFENIKLITDYYSIDITYQLEEVVNKNIYDYYIKNLKCDYNGIDYKLYVFFKGEQFNCFKFEESIYNYYLNKKNNKHINKKEESANLLKDEIVYIQNCSYLSDESKQKLLKSYEEHKINEVKKIKDKKNKNTKKVLIVLAILVLIVLSIIFWDIARDVLIFAFGIFCIIGVFHNNKY